MLRLKLSPGWQEKKIIVILIIPNVPLNAIRTFLSDGEEVNEKRLKSQSFPGNGAQ